jgi:hypothetical protein
LALTGFSRPEDVFKRVRIAVRAKSNSRQIPWESSSLVGDFYFAGAAPPNSRLAISALGDAGNATPSVPKVVSLAEVNRKDPKSTAGAILHAYRQRDLAALSALSHTTNREIFVNIIRNGEQDGRYRSLFSDSSGRWQSAQRWNGQLDEVRYRTTLSGDPPISKPVAEVRFGERAPDTILVVTLFWDNDQWCFEDFHSPSRETFELWSKVKVERN